MPQRKSDKDRVERDALYQYIIDTNKLLGRSPSRREMKKHVGITSTNGLENQLYQLEQDGKIELIPNEDYGIRLTNFKRGIPLKGVIAAGQPIENFVEPERMLDLGSELEDKNNYALIVRGTSMIDDGIYDGDYIIIREQHTCEHREIIVATHLIEPSRATLKRFLQEKGNVCLQPANNNINPIFIPNKEWSKEWQIQGIVLAIFRPYNKRIRWSP